MLSENGLKNKGKEKYTVGRNTLVFRCGAREFKEKQNFTKFQRWKSDSVVSSQTFQTSNRLPSQCSSQSSSRNPCNCIITTLRLYYIWCVFCHTHPLICFPHQAIKSPLLSPPHLPVASLPLSPWHFPLVSLTLPADHSKSSWAPTKAAQMWGEPALGTLNSTIILSMR